MGGGEVGGIGALEGEAQEGLEGKCKHGSVCSVVLWICWDENDRVMRAKVQRWITWMFGFGRILWLQIVQIAVQIAFFNIYFK